MTTMENAPMDLVDALRNAGVGGTLTRDETSYLVGRNQDGEWTMAADHSPANARVAIGYYVPDDWTVVTVGDPALGLEEDAPTWNQTLMGLKRGTYLSDGYNQYIFQGFGYDNDGARVANLVHAKYFNINEFDRDSLQSPFPKGIWEIVKNDDDTVKVADLTLSRAIRNIVLYNNDRRTAEKRVDELDTAYRAAVQDIKTLNVHLNAYAEEMSMCYDYERRIFSWNDGYANDQSPLTHKLVGRPRQYDVYVTIPSLNTREMHTTVEANSPQEAQELVRAMGKCELIKRIADSYDYGFDAAEVTVGEVLVS